MTATLILKGLPPGRRGRWPGVPGPPMAHLFNRGAEALTAIFKAALCITSAAQGRNQKCKIDRGRALSAVSFQHSASEHKRKRSWF